jgi:hypothetical protein
MVIWLGWLDSNQRMVESKSTALPLGYSPSTDKQNYIINNDICQEYLK